MGQIEYVKALELQVSLREKRMSGNIPDTLVLLEHPPVITIGRSGNMDNVLVSAEVLERQGIRLISSNRGGDVTYHGPGQLVGYTILDLSSYGTDLRVHLDRLEEVIIKTLERFSIRAGRQKACTGVWVGDEKIASIGLHIKRWVTMHGFALNVNPHLEHFSLIYPCGIRDKSTTSMERVLGSPLDMSIVRAHVTEAFGKVFRLTMEETDTPISAHRVASVPSAG